MDSITNIQNIVVEQTPEWLKDFILRTASKLEAWRVDSSDYIFIFKSKFVFYIGLLIVVYFVLRTIVRRLLKD